MKINALKPIAVPRKNPKASLFAAYLCYVLGGFVDDGYNYKTQALADRTNVEMIAATRAQDAEIQIRGEGSDEKETELDCYYEGDCDTLYVPKMSYGAINIADVLQHKYFLNQQYVGIIKEALIPNIFHSVHGQVGENHCYLFAMKCATYAATSGQKDLGIDSLASSLDRKLETNEGYARFWNMTEVIKTHIQQHNYAASSVISPSIREIEGVIDRRGYAVVAVRSAGGFLHRVTVVGKVDKSFIVVDSSKWRFDKNNNCIKFVGLGESDIAKMISVGTLELIGKSDFKKILSHSFAAEDAWARLLKNLSLNTINGAAIYVYPQNESRALEYTYDSFLPLGLGRELF